MSSSPAVVPADPGLVAAVVVGPAEHERRVALPDGAALVPSASRPRQTRMKALFSHSSPTVVGSVWPGCRRVSGGSSISTSMIDDFRSSKVVEPGARTPPTEPLNSVSPVNTSVPLTTKLSIPSVWPGVCSAPIFRPPASSTMSPGSIVRSTSSSRCGLQRVGQDLDAEALLVDVVLGHVVGVVVGQQQVRDRQVVLVDAAEQRLRRPARVDDHAVPAGLVGHEVGVGQPVGPAWSVR